jgi:hypothetical protein
MPILPLAIIHILKNSGAINDWHRTKLIILPVMILLQDLQDRCAAGYEGLFDYQIEKYHAYLEKTAVQSMTGTAQNRKI